jgi:hypothetical protein
MAGEFSSSSLTFGTLTLTSSGPENLYFVSFEESGNPRWVKSVESAFFEPGKCIAVDGTGSVYTTGNFGSTGLIVGTSSFINAGVLCDIFVAKITGNLGIIEDVIPEHDLKIYPNPVSSNASIKSEFYFKDAGLTIYNCYGAIVRKMTGYTGNEFILNRGSLPAGLYFIALEEKGTVVASAKFVVDD